MIWESTEISCKFEGMGNKDIFWRKRPWLSSENQRTTWYQKKKKLRTFTSEEKTSENKMGREEVREKVNEKEKLMKRENI